MFQFAAAYSYALKYNKQFVVKGKKPTNKTLPYNIRQVLSDKFPWDSTSKFFIFNLPRRNPFTPVHKTQQNICFSGQFQSEKWFKNHKHEIKSALEPPTILKNHLLSKYANILSHPNKVALNIRTYTPDYIIDQDKKNFHKRLHAYTPIKEYILEAINQFEKNSLFIVTSDNIDWCKKALATVERNFVFINHTNNEKSKKFTNNVTTLEDFYLITLCEHAIITPSTFGWWGAYLIKNPNKVIIAPQKFFKGPLNAEIFPETEEWIKL